MFIKGSRYRNLPESTLLNPRGERLLGKELRIIPPTPPRFLHTVSQGDRLDLLAFKYYGDPTRWWQVCDANPKLPFPTDLLDKQPLVEEQFVLVYPVFVERYNQLLQDLHTFGEVKEGRINLFDDKKFEDGKLREPEFLESTVVIIYSPSADTHKEIVDKINEEFQFLRSFSFNVQTKPAETFTFEDPAAKRNWRMLIDTLANQPGLLEVLPILTEASLRIVYNSAMISRESITAQIQLRGFSIRESSIVSRIGARIGVPPNQIV